MLDIFISVISIFCCFVFNQSGAIHLTGICMNVHFMAFQMENKKPSTQQHNMDDVYVVVSWFLFSNFVNHVGLVIFRGKREE